MSTRPRVPAHTRDSQDKSPCNVNEQTKCGPSSDPKATPNGGAHEKAEKKLLQPRRKRRGGPDMTAISTSVPLHMPTRKLRNTCGEMGGGVRGGVDTSSILPFCARCTMHKPLLLPRSRARSFVRGQRIRAPSESSGRTAQNKPLRAPAVKGEREHET